jgi:CheY-like chemotaxis protein
VNSLILLIRLKTALPLGGIQVETAKNGLLALDELNAGLNPNLIVTDINMLVSGGFETIRNQIMWRSNKLAT